LIKSFGYKLLVRITFMIPSWKPAFAVSAELAPNSRVRITSKNHLRSRRYFKTWKKSDEITNPFLDTDPSCRLL